jgi:hypothetical protein
MTRHLVVGRVRRAVLVAGLALAALPLPSAAADTTIGQTGGNRGCFGSGEVADYNYVVPSGGGMITSFSYESVAANAGQQLDFLVLRPTTPPQTTGAYTVVGKSGLVTLAGTGAETFPVSPGIFVRGGDILGLWTGEFQLVNCLRDVAGTGGGLGSADGEPDPSVGDTVELVAASTDLDVNVSANLAAVTGPTSKADCKNGGWRNFGDTFKNQGQCMTVFDTDSRRRRLR